MKETEIDSSKSHKILITGLLLFGFTLPFSKSANNVFFYLVILLAAIFAFRNVHFRLSVLDNLKQPLALSLILFLVVSIAGLLFSENISRGLRIVNKILNLPMIYLMMSVLIQSSGGSEEKFRNARRALNAFLAGLIVLDLIGLITYFGIVGGKKFTLPLQPMGMHHIWFANLNAVGLYASSSSLLFRQRKNPGTEEVLPAAFIIISLISIYLSTARSAWFGILLTTMMLSFIFLRNWKAVSAMTVLALITGIVLYQFNGIVHERIHHIYTDVMRFYAGDAATSVGMRLVMWKASFMMFLSNPFFGVGTGDYGVVIARYVSSGEFPAFLLDFNQPHNMFLMTLATNGMIGLAALLYIFYTALRHSYYRIKSPQQQERFFGMIAAAVAVHYMTAGLTDSFFNIQVLRYAFAFIMGVCIRYELSHQSAE